MQIYKLTLTLTLSELCKYLINIHGTSKWNGHRRFQYPQWKTDVFCVEKYSQWNKLCFLCRKIFDKKNIGSPSRILVSVSEGVVSVSNGQVSVSDDEVSLGWWGLGLGFWGRYSITVINSHRHLVYVISSHSPSIFEAANISGLLFPQIGLDVTVKLHTNTIGKLTHGIFKLTVRFNWMYV